MVVKYIFLLSFSFAFLFLFSIVYAHGDEEHDTLPSEVSVCHALSEGEREACFVSLCEGGVTEECAEDIVDAAVSGSGPKFALAVLDDLDEFFKVDTYALAQRVGRTLYTAGGEFMQCLSDFHYGCYYGFFEGASLDAGLTPPDFASTICDTISGASRDMCYHKMGHVFIKGAGHTLDVALHICSVFSSEATHCWDRNVTPIDSRELSPMQIEQIVSA